MARRIQVGAVILLAIAGLCLALAGSVVAWRGAQMPGGLSAALGAATSALAWLQWLSVAALAWGVARARKDLA